MFGPDDADILLLEIETTENIYNAPETWNFFIRKERLAERVYFFFLERV